YPITLQADDGKNPAATKRYILVLLSPPKNDCPGTAPQIAHTPPGNQTTLANLAVSAMVSDDEGVKGSPLLYYSTEPPASPPDLAPLPMSERTRTPGDARSGFYQGEIPNPVASSGRTATLYYLIAAKDDDDPNGTCDHLTQVGPYSFAVTAGGGEAVAFCGPCV